MPLGFKQFMNVEYKPGEDDQVNLNAKKRKRGDTEHESVEMEARKYTQAQRIAIGRKTRQRKKQLKLKRDIWNKRLPDLKRIKKRAKRSARNFFAKRLTKGVAKSDLTAARKSDIEKRLNSKNFQVKINRRVKKTLKDVRQRAMRRR